MTRAANLAEAAGSGFAFRNRIINGDMRIDQRNAGASGSITPSVASSVPATDLFTVSIYGSTYASPAISFQRVADAPSGFTRSLKITSSATLTPDANKLGGWIRQGIEGLNVSDLGWGATGASSITVSFWVKSSKTGTVSVSFENAATTRSYVATVSIASAATWEYKTVTIPGDTTGTWATDNTLGISMIIGLFTNGSWLAGTGGAWSGTRALLSTAQTNFLAASGDYLAITGVQLEKGSVATPFEFRPYGAELALCQRYCFSLNPSRASQGYVRFPMGMNISTTATACSIQLPTPMRAIPSLTWSGNFETLYGGSGTGSSVTIGSDTSNTSLATFYFNYSAGTVTNGVANSARIVNNTAWNAYFEAEL